MTHSNEDQLLVNSIEATITVPTDLSSELDGRAFPLVAESTISVTIEGPHEARVLVNALAVTLDTALRATTATPTAAVHD